MDLAELKELLRSVVENDISDFEYEESGVKIRIKRKRPVVGALAEPPALNAHPPAINAASANLTPAAPSERLGERPNAEGLHALVSPIVGTFYNAPTPGADPFVHVGDYVQEGAVLCIVEAMKLMNEIKSDVAGKIVDILVTNAQPVEYGQTLFLIQPRK